MIAWWSGCYPVTGNTEREAYDIVTFSYVNNLKEEWTVIGNKRFITKHQ